MHLNSNIQVNDCFRYLIFVKTEVPKDEVPQPVAVAVVVRTETVEDINEKQIQLKEDIAEKKSNKEDQSPQYVAEDTAEINTNSYTDEHDKVQTSHAEVNQGNEGDQNFGQEEEASGIEETNKMQLPKEEVQIRSPIHPFVQGVTDQISQQELLHINESEVIDYVKQSCTPEIELDRKSTAVQVRPNWREQKFTYITCPLNKLNIIHFRN